MVAAAIVSSDIFKFKGAAAETLSKERVDALFAAVNHVSANVAGAKKPRRGATFWVDEKGANFRCALRSLKCCAKSKRSGSACRRNVVQGLFLCYQHTQSLLGLRIDRSGVIFGGKYMNGLFACDASVERGEVVFRRGAEVCPYYGEILNKTQLSERYHDVTAPYALQVGRNKFIDSACFQSIGSKSNKPQTGGYPNARFVVSPSLPYARIVATKPIRNGDEVFVGYGASYKFTHSGVTPKPHATKKKQHCGG